MISGLFTNLSSLLWCVAVRDLLFKAVFTALVTLFFAASMLSSDRRDEVPLECTSLLTNLSIAIVATCTID